MFKLRLQHDSVPGRKYPSPIFSLDDLPASLLVEMTHLQTKPFSHLFACSGVIQPTYQRRGITFRPVLTMIIYRTISQRACTRDCHFKYARHALTSPSLLFITKVKNESSPPHEQSVQDPAFMTDDEID